VFTPFVCQNFNGIADESSVGGLYQALQKNVGQSPYLPNISNRATLTNAANAFPCLLWICVGNQTVVQGGSLGARSDKQNRFCCLDKVRYRYIRNCENSRKVTIQLSPLSFYGQIFGVVDDWVVRFNIRDFSDTSLVVETFYVNFFSILLFFVLNWRRFYPKMLQVRSRTKPTEKVREMMLYTYYNNSSTL
jgi:hypothetical protein